MACDIKKMEQILSQKLNMLFTNSSTLEIGQNDRDQTLTSRRHHCLAVCCVSHESESTLSLRALFVLCLA